MTLTRSLVALFAEPTGATSAVEVVKVSRSAFRAICAGVVCLTDILSDFTALSGIAGKARASVRVLPIDTGRPVFTGIGCALVDI